MTRRISSGAPWEPVVGYSRAVVAGDHVWVSGCTSVRDGEVVHEGDAYAQTVQTIRNVAAALAQAGASLSDVVRTRMFVTDISRWEEYSRAHGEAFRDVMPAASMVEVRALIDPRMLVEVEAVAYHPASARPPPDAPASPRRRGRHGWLLSALTEISRGPRRPVSRPG
jgi:enamine deaminase RidA (YjgF/YER057c/UK114 family)